MNFEKVLRTVLESYQILGFLLKPNSWQKSSPCLENAHFIPNYRKTCAFLTFLFLDKKLLSKDYFSFESNLFGFLFATS